MALVFFNRYFFWSVVFKNRLLCAYGSLEETQEKSQWVEDGETKPPATVSWEACQREAWPTSPQRFRLYDGPSGWVGGLEAAGSLGKLISSSSQPSGASTGPRRWSLLPAWVPTAMLVLSRWLCRAPGAHWGLRRAATHPPGSRRSPLGVLLGGTSPPPADYLTADVAAPTCTLPRRRGKNRRCMLRAVPPMVTTSYCYCRHYWFSRVDPNERASLCCLFVSRCVPCCACCMWHGQTTCRHYGADFIAFPNQPIFPPTRTNLLKRGEPAFCACTHARFTGCCAFPRGSRRARAAPRRVRCRCEATQRFSGRDAETRGRSGCAHGSSC